MHINMTRLEMLVLQLLRIILNPRSFSHHRRRGMTQPMDLSWVTGIMW